ncbi:MAG TPA: GMC family oxidoreductase [Acidimicrobiia bacterium]|nr:GMC family oxidoreductase [Acidimicrobiia bacterium]
MHYDVLVIGSGFGGSVSALRLTEKGYRVGVLEAGRRFRSADFPRSNWNVRRFFWFPRLGMRGIQRMTLLHDVLILSGAGVGGGSLVYAATLYRPGTAFYDDPQWSHITNWREELAPHFAAAEAMLGSSPSPADTPADEVLRRVAEHFGVADTFRANPVGVFFGDPGVEVDDPYFGGTGPRRAGCVACGGCMVGCRYDAKNSLDRNYLYLAERAGARVHPEHEVFDVSPRRSGGYEVATRRPGAWLQPRLDSFTADQVVLAAGALGTTRLLLQLRERGRLPSLSSRVGHRVRTNSEAIIGSTAKDNSVDYSQGVAITSAIHLDAHTHVQPVRYPKGSNVMGLLATLLTDGGPGAPRQLRFLGNVLRHPVSFVRSLSVHRWAERSVILLVMQDHDNSLRLSLRRGWLGWRLRSEQDHGRPSPTYIPKANEAARVAASVMNGIAGSALNEVLLDVPTSAHILGGAGIGEGPETGVIDPYHRVFGHPGLHVLDGSAIGANLGVNPALTITAMAERAMSLWPNHGEADPRPPLGSPYHRLQPIPPRAPAVEVG